MWSSRPSSLMMTSMSARLGYDFSTCEPTLYSYRSNPAKIQWSVLDTHLIRKQLFSDLGALVLVKANVYRQWGECKCLGLWGKGRREQTLYTAGLMSTGSHFGKRHWHNVVLTQGQHSITLSLTVSSSHFGSITAGLVQLMNKVIQIGLVSSFALGCSF